MNYQEAMDYIQGLEAKGSILGLERIRGLLKALGEPQEKLKVIHVAGTNGKGSVCAILSQVLEAAGYQVGRYISPTLLDYRERIQINHQWISKEETADYLTRLSLACEALVAQGMEHPTAFEIETAMAFLFFQDKHCDYLVLEVGMGGRMDSTNVCTKPLVSVITSISLDHLGILGNSLEEIAYEKAGIIKAGCPVVTAPQKPEVFQVIKKVCQTLEASLSVARTLEVSQADLRGQNLESEDYPHLRLSLPGAFQPENAGVVLTVLSVLRKMSQDLDKALQETVIRQGFSEVSWPGRFEIIHDHPLIIADGAHNPDAAAALAASIKSCLQGRELIYMMGVFADKDYVEILKQMASHSQHIITYTPSNARGLDSQQLALAAKAFYPQVEACDTLELALERALKAAGSDKVIISFGSLSTVGSLHQQLK